MWLRVDFVAFDGGLSRGGASFDVFSREFVGLCVEVGVFGWNVVGLFELFVCGVVGKYDGDV